MQIYSMHGIPASFMCSISGVMNEPEVVLAVIFLHLLKMQKNLNWIQKIGIQKSKIKLHIKDYILGMH